jgi:hypothetical protein
VTLVAHARAAQPWWRRLQWRPELVAAASAVVAFALQLLAGWPGWLTPQTIGQWTQARTGPFTDAYPAALTWFWAQMDPAGRGPFVPFLLQVFLFWLGVALIAVALQPAARWTRFLPLIVLLNPISWMVVVVSAPSAVVCVVVAALGIASLGLRAFRNGRRRNGTIALWTAAVAMGFGALGGGILSLLVAALLMLLTAALSAVLLPGYLGGRARLETGAKAVVLTLVSALVASVVLPLLVIGNVGHSRAGEAFYALDAFHVDCAPTWSTGRITTAPVSPQGLWRGGLAPCNTGTPGDFGDDWAGAADPASAQVLGFGQWLRIALADPAIVIGGRLQHATAMLGSSYPYTPDLDGGELVAAPAAGGAGEVAGIPNRGGVALALYATLTSFLPASMLLWVLLIPVGVAVWVIRSARRPRTVAVLPLLAWPPVAGLALGMAAPFDDASVMAPAAVLGWVLSLLAVAAARMVMPAEDTELLRYAGPYPGTTPVSARGSPCDGGSAPGTRR